MVKEKNRYSYKKTNGKAHDLRYIEKEYDPSSDEIVGKCYELPPIESLHDPAYLVKEKEKEDKEKAFEDTFKGKKKSEITADERTVWVLNKIAEEFGLEE